MTESEAIIEEKPIIATIGFCLKKNILPLNLIDLEKMLGSEKMKDLPVSFKIRPLMRMIQGYRELAGKEPLLMTDPISAIMEDFGPTFSAFFT